MPRGPEGFSSGKLLWVAALLSALALLGSLLVHAHAKGAGGSPPVSLVVELPPGQKHYSNTSLKLPLPGSYIFWLIVESNTGRLVRYKLDLKVEGDASLEKLSGPLEGVLQGYGDRAILYGLIEAGSGGFKLIARLQAQNRTRSIALHVANVELKAGFSSVYLPVDYLGVRDPRREPFTLVESYPSPLRKLLGVGENILLGYMRVCVRSSMPGSFLVLGRVYDSKGRPAPVASTVITPGAGSPYIRSMVVVNSTAGRNEYHGCIVVPLWSLAEVIPPGRYRLTLGLYLPGSARPLATYSHDVIVRLLYHGDIVTALAATLTGALVLVPLARVKDSRRIAYMALTGASLTALVRIIGGILLRLSQVLGPFDWIVYGPVTSGLYYGLLAACLAATGDWMVTAGAVLVEWLLSSLILSPGNIVLSSLWVLTTLSVVALAGYAALRTRLGLLPIYFGLAKILDSYVDINLYAFIYRLYYAHWYVAAYSLGMGFYASLGTLLALRMVRGHAGGTG